MIAGDYTSIEETAVKIKNSFILKQKLTPVQKEELHTKLPQNFIAQDSAFHNDVANIKTPELTQFYFKKMLFCFHIHRENNFFNTL